MLQVGRTRARFSGQSFGSLRPHYGPAVDSVSDRNKYQGNFLGGKGGRCVGLRALSSSCAECLDVRGASTSWKPKGLSRLIME